MASLSVGYAAPYSCGAKARSSLSSRTVSLPKSAFLGSGRQILSAKSGKSDVKSAVKPVRAVLAPDSPSAEKSFQVRPPAWLEHGFHFAAFFSELIFASFCFFIPFQTESASSQRADPKSVVSVILGGGAGTRLYPLTKIRAKPAVSSRN